MFKVPDWMCDCFKGSVILLPSVHLFHAFIYVVMVPSILAQLPKALCLAYEIAA